MPKKPFVITGGPSVGKTTIIEILRSRGFKVMDECSRIILNRELAKGSDILPWKDHARFQEEVMKKQIEVEAEIAKSGTDVVFLDRGLVDGYAYDTLRNVPIPELLVTNLRNRYEKVFFIEPLETYTNDSLRVEDRELAMRIHEEIRKSYITWGYDIISVPNLPAEKRVDYILECI